MIEIAICLAIIGIALVGIIAVLPAGMHTQRDNRQETLIAQDANFLMDLVRNGSHGPDDLTNYIYAVTNYWVALNANGGIASSGVNGYDYYGASKSGGSAPAFSVLVPINSGSNIVSLLSTPEFMDANGVPLTTIIGGGISNHVVAYVRAISGLAAEKGPQANQILQEDSFSYRVLAVNAPVAMSLPPLWVSGTYNAGSTVYCYSNQMQWITPNGAVSADLPGASTNWVRSNPYADQLMQNQRELRLRFAWPQLPNGNLAGNSRFLNFRTTIGGRLAMTNSINPNGLLLYYYQPQTYTQLP